MGPVARTMLQKLIDTPDGESGFREGEYSKSAVKHGWALWQAQLGRIYFFKITDAGRAAYHACVDRKRR